MEIWKVLFRCKWCSYHIELIIIFFVSVILNYILINYFYLQVINADKAVQQNENDYQVALQEVCIPNNLL